MILRLIAIAMVFGPIAVSPDNQHIASTNNEQTIQCLGLAWYLEKYANKRRDRAFLPQL